MFKQIIRRTEVKILIYLGLLFLFLLVQAFSQRIGPPSIKPEDKIKAPPFSLYNVDGKKINLKDYRGKKKVILFFFATWCPACQNEVSRMQKLYNKIDRQKVEILAIDLRESKRIVESYRRRRKITFPILLDTNGRVASTYGIRGIPVFVVVDKKGYVTYGHIGPNPRFEVRE